MRKLVEEARKKGPLIERELLLSATLHNDDFEETFNKIHSRKSPFQSGAISRHGEIILATKGFKLQGSDTLDLGDNYAYHYHFKTRYERKRETKGFNTPFKILIISLTVSIILGLILTSIIVTFYFNRKSKEAEKIMSEIISGNLKARFKLEFQDENFGLMVKFNQMADQIENLVLSLQQRKDEQTRVLQELAHDLRTPIASLNSLNQLLHEKSNLIDEAKKEELHSLMQKEINYFSKLVEELLFLSGVNDPKYTRNFEKINLSHLIEDEINLFRNNGKEIIFEPAEVQILGDKQLIKRLIKNALSNALKHAHKKIKISLKSQAIMIEDDGPGLSPEDIEVFGKKRFTRALSDEISIGLGSVIMQKIAELHGGKILIENTYPGARLTILFENLWE